MGRQRAHIPYPRSDDIVAYAYRASIYCPVCIVLMVMMHKQLMALPEDGGTEGFLDMAAELFGYDRTNESSYDSGDFPKVVFRDEAKDYAYSHHDHMYCDRCTQIIA